MIASWRPALLLLFGCPAVGLGAGGAIAVSPGSPEGAVIESRCPTFSWSTVPGAKSYELVVYRLRDDADETEPILRETFRGSVSVWTPSLDACLEHGGRYAWSVRTLGPEKSSEWSEWSEPGLFRVTSTPSAAELLEALQEVQRVFGESQEASRTDPFSSPQWAHDLPAPLVMLAGDAAVQVNGAAVVTTASLGAGLCQALTYRYVDRGDGTVLDCNTGKIWLKDAGCLGTGTWDLMGAAGSVQSKLAQLNNGTQFSCSSYTPGTYTDWELPVIRDFCHYTVENFGVCPTDVASLSLIDSGVSGAPKVVNARGNGSWSEADAFTGVKLDQYWSASCFESCFIDAIFVNLVDGSYAPVVQVNTFYLWPVRGGG